MSVESANQPNSVGNGQELYGWQNYTAQHSHVAKPPVEKHSLRRRIVLIIAAIPLFGVGVFFGIKGIGALSDYFKEIHRANTTAEKKLYRTANGQRVANISSKIPDMVYEGKTNDEIISYLDDEIANTNDRDMKTYIKTIKGSFIVGYVDIDSGIEYLKEIENESNESYVKEAVYSHLANAYKAKGDTAMSDYYNNEAVKYQ